MLKSFNLINCDHTSLLIYCDVKTDLFSAMMTKNDTKDEGE